MKRSGVQVLSVGEDPPLTKTRADSISQALIVGIPGVLFLGIMNSRRRYFVPSTQNFFGDIQVSRVLCDSGCSSILLPVDSKEDLKKIFSNHADCAFNVGVSRGVGGQSLFLVVKARGRAAWMKACLCRDILGGTDFDLKYLRFSLCSDDISSILTEHGQHMCDADLQLLRQHETKHPTRRTHALLGQEVLNTCTMVRHLNCELYVDASIYCWPKNYTELENQILSLKGQIRDLLPEEFQDWEDDDFHFDDEEYVDVELFL